MRSRGKTPYDLVVLGGGTGGLVSAQVAAGAGARVAIVERERPGGDCLWTGCVPSKSLIAAADLAHAVRRAQDYGVGARLDPIDLGRVMERVQRVIAEIEPQDSPQRLREAGVEVIEGSGAFTDSHTLTVDARQVRFRSAIVATGAAPVLPAIPGLEGTDILTSDTIWGLRELPERLVVLGAGPVGCELGQAFGRLGAQVTIVDVADRLLSKDEPEASRTVAQRLAVEGIALHLRTRAVEVRRNRDGQRQLAVDGPGGPGVLEFDALLVAVGRRPRTEGIGLDLLGIRTDEHGLLPTADDMRTSARHVFAVGDVTGRMPFTHVAAHHARIATLNALFGTRRRVDPVLPWVTFTRPEVAHVGLTLAEARERHGDAVTVARTELAALDRAVTEGRPVGFCLLVGDRRGRLVGATVVGGAAGEVIAELTARVKHGDRIDALSTTFHAYPTMAEGPARAADEYLRQKYARPLPRTLARLALAARRLTPPR
jgi:pyruvate/2-oxoglutarate dehydrogenase complex dihydrolipoamide dehydrogenase (E3) component